MQIIFDDGATDIRGVKQDEDFTVVVQENPALTANVVTPFVDRDANFAEKSGTLLGNGFILSVSPSLTFGGSPVFKSLTPAASVDASGHVAYQSEGQALVTITFPPPLGQRAYARLMKGGGASVIKKYFESYLPGTLGAHVTDAINGMISGKTPGNATKNLFTTNNYNLSDPVVVRNTDVFTASLDLSAISVMNERSGVGAYVHPAMLISPRHIIGAKHFPPGQIVVFMGSDGVMQTANVVSRQNHVGGVIRYSGTSDVQVAYLDREINGIAPFKFLPADWADYLPTGKREAAYASPNYKQIKLPALTKTAHNAMGGSADQISITEVIELDDTDHTLSAMLNIGYLETVLPTRTWNSPTVGGDSGGPVFIPINDQLVILMCWWHAGDGTNLADVTSYITTAMNELSAAYVLGGGTDAASGSYAVQTVDISGFTSYA